MYFALIFLFYSFLIFHMNIVFVFFPMKKEKYNKSKKKRIKLLFLFVLTFSEAKSDWIRPLE